MIGVRLFCVKFDKISPPFLHPLLHPLSPSHPPQKKAFMKKWISEKGLTFGFAHRADLDEKPKPERQPQLSDEFKKKHWPSVEFPDVTSEG